MRLQLEKLFFSATDLGNFIECEHLTALDLRGLSDGEFRSAKVKPDESAELIARKGNEHEHAYLERLRSEGKVVVDIAAAGGSLADKVARTLAAMREGPDVIFQATLQSGSLFGHADFLMRVDGLGVPKFS